MEEIRSPSTVDSVEKVPGDGGAMEGSTINLIEEASAAEVAEDDGAAKRAKPDEEVAGDGAAKRAMPEDEEAAKPKVEVGDDFMTPAESLKQRTDTVDYNKHTWPVPDEASVDGAETKLVVVTPLQHARLMAGAKLRKVKKRVEPAGIEACLRMGLLQPHPAGRTAVRVELPECLQHMPESFRAAFLRNKAIVKKAMDYQQDIVDQYYEKGYAEVDAYVVE